MAGQTSPAVCGTDFEVDKWTLHGTGPHGEGPPHSCRDADLDGKGAQIWHHCISEGPVQGQELDLPWEPHCLPWEVRPVVPAVEGLSELKGIPLGRCSVVAGIK